MTNYRAALLEPHPNEMFTWMSVFSNFKNLYYSLEMILQFVIVTSWRPKSFIFTAVFNYD